jgi:TPR repeat protein
LVDYIDWTKEPDVGQLRTLVELLAKNPAEALPGLELLAQRGSVAACSHLAYFYLEGGPAEFLDINRAKYWYLKAQERGDPEAEPRRVRSAGCMTLFLKKIERDA